MPLPQDRASFCELKSLCICIIPIFHNQVMANLEISSSLFRRPYFEKFQEFFKKNLTSLFLGKNNPILRISLNSESEWCCRFADLTENSPYVNKDNGCHQSPLVSVIKYMVIVILYPCLIKVSHTSFCSIIILQNCMVKVSHTSFCSIKNAG